MSRWDDFIDSLGPLTVGLFVILGIIAGGLSGFMNGGIGGAILGIMCGAVVGVLAWIVFVFCFAILWTLFILLIRACGVEFKFSIYNAIHMTYSIASEREL